MGRERVFGGLALVVLHFVLQVGLGLGDGVPDLATLSVLILAREAGATFAAATGFVVGLLQDALSAVAFGAGAFALALAGTLGSASRDLFVGESRLFVFWYFLVGKWGSDVVRWMVGGRDGGASILEALLVDAPLAAVYMAGCGVLAMLVVGTVADGRRG